MNKSSSSNTNPFKLSEADLALYPPYVSRLVGVIVCMMLSQGLTLTVATITYFDLRPDVMLAVVLLPTIPLVSANFYVLHGRRKGIIWQQTILAFYGVASALMLIEFLFNRLVFPVPAISLALALFGIYLTRTQGYSAMFAFLKKRWAIYRETGRTILEEYNRVVKK